MWDTTDGHNCVASAHPPRSPLSSASLLNSTYLAGHQPHTPCNHSNQCHLETGLQKKDTKWKKEGNDSSLTSNHRWTNHFQFAVPRVFMQNSLDRQRMLLFSSGINLKSLEFRRSPLYHWYVTSGGCSSELASRHINMASFPAVALTFCRGCATNMAAVKDGYAVLIKYILYILYLAYCHVLAQYVTV